MTSLARLERPEYTGENRCWPCTVGNAVILTVGCLALALVSPLFALVVLLVGSGAIALRGYLVPYTPELTARIRERLVGESDRRRTGSLTTANETDGERTLAALLEAGVLVADGERLFLDEAFREAWRAEMDRLGGLSGGGLVEEVDATLGGFDAELIEADRPLVAVLGPDGGEAWVSFPVAIGELGADRALSGRTSLSKSERLAAARALRAFLDRCPACETPTEELDPRGCCGNPRTRRTEPVLACPACDEWLYRFDSE
ncbi:MAG: hypothetical protein QXG03_06690 [Halalkalicoccus sp.]